MLVDFDDTNVDPDWIVSKHIGEKFFEWPLTSVSWKGIAGWKLWLEID
jgi:hypothetical protein